MSVDSQGLLQGGLSAAASINKATDVMVANNPQMEQIKGFLAKAELTRQNAQLDLQKSTLNLNIQAQQMQHALDVQKMQMAQDQFGKTYDLQKQQLALSQTEVDNQLKLGLGSQNIQQQGVDIQEQGLQQQSQQFGVTSAQEEQKINMPQSEIGKFMLDVGKQSPGNQQMMETLFSRGMIKLPPGYSWGANGGIQQIPGYTPTANQEPANATKIASLQQGQQDWNNVKNTLVNKDGSINRSVLWTAKGAIAGTKGRELQSAMERSAMSIAKTISPRSASDEQIKSTAHSFLPDYKDTDNEITSKVNNLGGVFTKSLGLISGKQTPADQVGNQLSMSDREQLKSMGYSDDQIDEQLG